MVGICAVTVLSGVDNKGPSVGPGCCEYHSWAADMALPESKASGSPEQNGEKQVSTRRLRQGWGVGVMG